MKRAGVLVALAAAVLAGACTDEVSVASDALVASACGPDDDGAAPSDLRCTGLYADLATKTVSPRARAYAPARSFWSDGADKQRWIDLPDGASIDATSMDDWRFPVGTKVWKEMSLHGRRVETRFFWKVKEDRWVFAAYLWSPDETSAVRVDGAEVDVDGTPYRVPKASDCAECHSGRRDKLLGFEAVSLGLPGASGWTLAALAAEGRLAPAPATTAWTIGNDGTGHAAEALGWLHVNCGITCHNGNSSAKAYATGLRLRIATADLAHPPDASWDAIRTTVGVTAVTPAWAGEPRIVRGDPAASLLLRLARTRGQNEQMPPIATTIVDHEGTSAVDAWITAMAPGRKSTESIDRSAAMR